MPRNGSGTYTLPAGNPVVSGDVIESSWANSTLSDIADSMTNSLARNGEGGMTAALRLVDGTVTVPGLAFANETGSGLYRAAAGDVGLAVLGSRILRLQAAGASVTGTLGVSGNTTLANLEYTGTLTGGTGVINIGSGQVYKDASGNVGIGTSSPASKLHVIGSEVRLQGSASFYSFYDTAGTTRSGYLQNNAGSLAFVGELAQPMTFWTNNTLRATLDSSGNLGLGVTPSAWGASVKALQFDYGAFSGSSTLGTEVVGNGYYNGTNWIYRFTGVALRYNQATAGHSWHVASGTAGNAISFTQAMTLDASGRLGIGTSSPQCRLQVHTASSATTFLRLTNEGVGATLGYGGALQGYGVSGLGGYLEVGVVDAGTFYPGMIVAPQAANVSFKAGGTERARIVTTGLVVGATSNSFGQFGIVASDGSSSNIGLIPVSGAGYSFKIVNGDPNVVFENNSSIREYVFVKNSGANYATVTAIINNVSDRRLKENVTPLTNALSRIEQLNPVVYSFKEDVKPAMPWGTELVDGFLADEFGEVIVGGTYGVKDAVNEDGEIVPQSIDMTRAIPLMVAAIQELNAKIDALKSVPTA